MKNTIHWKLLSALIVRKWLHFIEIKHCKKRKKIVSALSHMLNIHHWYVTYFSCLASQSCCMDGTFHCTNSTRQLDKWWARPKGSNPRLTSTWPIQKLLSPPERPRLNWLVSSVFQRHWWLQERIKQYLIFIILFSKLITKDDEWA